MGHTAASKHHDIIIDDPVLTDHGFTKISLPLNSNSTVMVVHNTDKSKMMYPKFYKSDLDKTVQSLREKIVSDSILIDDDTADGLVAYFRNEAVLLSEDPDSVFFKNGNGNGKAKVKVKAKQRQQQERSAEEEEKPADNCIIISFERWQTKLIQKYNELYYTVHNNLPHLWPSLEFDLSIKNILHIKDCTLSFAGIVLGKPSSLKTVGIEMFRKSKHTYYTDNFTARSLVSHNSGLTEEKLQQIDLLPKIKNRCFLTPELAPTFSAKDDDLIQFIGIVTRVLDGHGYENDSGAHGHRGYNERMMFVWIGAAVDIPFKVHKLLTTLGPKLYFFRVPKAEQKSEDNYYQQLQHNDFDAKLGQIEQALLDYQEWFEAACPVMVHDDKFGSSVRKMPWISADSSDEHQQKQKQAYTHIIKLGKLLAHLRGVVPTWPAEDTQGSEYGYGMPTIEEPDRAMQQLVNLARGHALLTGRNHVTIEDIPLIVKVVLSTAPIERVTIFDLLLANNGRLNVNQITKFLNVSEPTARRTMTELKALGLVDRKIETIACDDGIPREGLVITLKEQFDWFLSVEFKTLREEFKPESDSSNSNNDASDDDNNNNDSAPGSGATSSSATVTKGRPKTDWNSLLENKAVKEKFPPRRDQY